MDSRTLAENYQEHLGTVPVEDLVKAIVETGNGEIAYTFAYDVEWAPLTTLGEVVAEHGLPSTAYFFYWRYRWQLDEPLLAALRKNVEREPKVLEQLDLLISESNG